MKNFVLLGGGGGFQFVVCCRYGGGEVGLVMVPLSG